MRKRLLTTFVLLLLAQQALATDNPQLNDQERRSTDSDANITPQVDWPRWRGPDGNGVADGQNVPLRWSRTENITWSAKLPGWGTSSPVVYGDRVFVTSQEEQAGKKSLLTLCFDRTTGSELWRHDFGFGFDQRTHEKSNLAPNTPAVTEDAVYVLFGNAEMARYSHQGELAWVKRMVPLFNDPKGRIRPPLGQAGGPCCAPAATGAGPATRFKQSVREW